MNVDSFSQARNSSESILDGMVDDAGRTFITHRDAEDAVIMSLNYYNSLIGTVHLLRSPANAAHLAKSIAQYQQAKVTQRELTDD